MTWLSPEEVADRTPLSRKGIYGAIRRGELPATKRCGKWFIDEAELERWVRGGEQPRPPVSHVPETSSSRSRARPPSRGSLAALQAIERGQAA